MPSNISKARLQKAFNEGRRSANVEAAENPYDNPKLQKLWEEGRAKQRSGELATPIPALSHGETRAVSIPVEARWNGEVIDVAGSLEVALADHGMTPPTRSFVSVDDVGTMEFQLTFVPA